jgi:Rab proteins geranylgeranyltransferase component A
LTLSPHLIYSLSALLPALVSSQLHTQLDFQAVGPWWIYKDGAPAAIEHEIGDAEIEREDSHVIGDSRINGQLQKIPSIREDVFADDTLSPRDKRSLMKFLRSVLSEPASEAEPAQDVPLSVTLSSQFRVAPSIHQPLLALSLSYDSTDVVKTSSAVSRIRRHMRSIGAFGPGFGAVMPKYGGGAEIAQVACRASAVGGAVYVLGRGLRKVRKIDGRCEDEQTSTTGLAHLELSDGEEIRARFIAGCAEDFPEDELAGTFTDSNVDLVKITHSISIVSSPLEHLFPPTSENGPMPAGAVVVNTGDDHGNRSPHVSVSGNTPTYMIIHSSDSGECPPGQCKSCLTLRRAHLTSSHLMNHIYEYLSTLSATSLLIKNL